MKKEDASVYRFDYTLSESSWIAYIAGFSQEEAVRELYRTVGIGAKISTSGYECRLDGISLEFRESIVRQVRAQLIESLDEKDIMNRKLQRITEERDILASTLKQKMGAKKSSSSKTTRNKSREKKKKNK